MEKEERNFKNSAQKPLLMGLIVCGFILLPIEAIAQEIKISIKLYQTTLDERVKNRFDADTYQRMRESYPFFVQISEKTKAELQKQTDKDKATVDSLKKALAALQKTDEPVKVKPKPKMYRIKRIWQNSDTKPWTYNAYTIFCLRSSSNGGRFYSRHEATLKMGGKARYVGENRLDYVNVVFSDNSFRQFKIKDSPEWILAKEGELVWRDGDKFVPLFKK